MTAPALPAPIDEVEKALEPFAADVDSWGSAVPDDHAPIQVEMGHWDARYYGSAAKFTVGDLRRARKALAALRAYAVKEER